MECFPQIFSANNAPLIAISGLGQGPRPPSRDDHQPSTFFNQGFKLVTPAPPLSEAGAAALRSEFERINRSTLGADRFHSSQTQVILIGREYTFPSRKAAPAPQTPSASPPRTPTTPNSATLVLHSPLSPLSSVSPLFPDGLMTPAWLTKHQYHVPAVFVFFFELNAHPEALAGEVDIDLKAEINAIRSSLARSGFRSRLAVVVVPSDATVAVENAEIRLNGIRRAIGLDAKTSFFYFPTLMSKEDCANFASALLNALRPTCIEYYRDLTKHSRRKRGRGFLPVSSSSRASTSLSAQAWNTRYDFKMGVFAEFRCEWDVAEKHYLSATDNLFDSEGPLLKAEHARRDDVITFADVIALRLIRCQLSRGSPNTAAEQWSKQRRRLAVVRNDDGYISSRLTWSHWDRRWTAIMAQLVEGSSIPAFTPQPTDFVPPDLDENDESSRERQVKQPVLNTTFTISESGNAATDRVVPFNLLHHPGYWYDLAARKYTASSSDNTNALQVSALCEHAASCYLERGQLRASHCATLRRARALTNTGAYAEAFDLLEPLWRDSLWRSEGWWTLFGQLLSLVEIAASETDASKTRTEAGYEAMCKQLLSTRDTAEAGAGIMEAKTPIIFADRQRLAPVTATLAFAKARAFVGDTAPCQIVILSNLRERPHQAKLSSVTLVFGDGVSVELNHRSDVASPVAVQIIQLERRTQSASSRKRQRLEGYADLTIDGEKPLVLDLALPLRTAEHLHLSEIRCQTRMFGSELTVIQTTGLSTSLWWMDTRDGLKVRDRRRPKSCQVLVLPKPPRVAIRLPTMREQYFTNERVRLAVELENGESASITGVLEAKMIERSGEGRLRLVLDTADAADPVNSVDDDRGISSTAVETLDSGSIRTYHLWFDAPPRTSDIDFAITVIYELDAEASTPAAGSSSCTRTLNLQMSFSEPFQVALELQPRYESGPWPDFFAVPGFDVAEHEPTGLSQSWLMKMIVTNNAGQALRIDGAAMSNNDDLTSVKCDFSRAFSESARIVEARKATSVHFPFTARSETLEDRRNPGLVATIEIKWRRQSGPSDPPTTTIISVPKHIVPPVEPRVLCAVTASRDVQGVRATELTYSLENPSMHFLTFNVNMQASTDFAFEGAKSKSLSLTPMSRTELVYTLYLHCGKSRQVSRERSLEGKSASQSGQWVAPSLHVVDAYFQKTLRVLAASEDVRQTDQGGIEIWVAASES